jgi:dienelactone hydrolase
MSSFRDKLATRLGGVVDQALLVGLGRRFRRQRPGERQVRVPVHTDRRQLLGEAIAFYQRPEMLSGEALFVAPRPARPVLERRGGLPGGGEIVDAKWESGWAPRWERVREDYLSHAPNRFAHARLYLQPRPAPTLVCIHGYRSGHYFVEERAFPARWLHQLGLNVALPQLPFHAHRGGAAAPVWPSVNVGRANEGFGQAIHDLRALIGWLQAQHGAQPVAACGISLGGYTASLLATVEPLAAAMFIIPVASFAELLWEHGRGSAERARAEREGITVDMLMQAMACHTPLARAPRVAPERVLVAVAEGDRVVPPVHGERLARHFGVEEMRLAGGHLWQLRRGDLFRTLARRLAGLGIIPGR